MELFALLRQDTYSFIATMANISEAGSKTKVADSYVQHIFNHVPVDNRFQTYYRREYGPVAAVTDNSIVDFKIAGKFMTLKRCSRLSNII